MVADLTSRCDASSTGTEAAFLTWLRLDDDRELRLCIHHSNKHGHALAEAGFTPVPDGMGGESDGYARTGPEPQFRPQPES